MGLNKELQEAINYGRQQGLNERYQQLDEWGPAVRGIRKGLRGLWNWATGSGADDIIPNKPPTVTPPVGRPFTDAELTDIINNAPTHPKPEYWEDQLQILRDRNPHIDFDNNPVPPYPSSDVGIMDSSGLTDDQRQWIRDWL
mgnify:CR=1 FL=1